MKFSYNWLKELSGTKKNAQEVADLLTMHAFEVESVHETGAALDGVIVGEVLSVKKHPDADRLRVALVRLGSSKEEKGETPNVEIVCGAPNVEAGQRVPVATIGTVLPNGTKIEKSKIRGVTSHGMICAEDELGIGDGHDGIVVLDPKTPVGSAFSDVLKIDDTVIDIDILPNRGHDCLSHNGVAREIAAASGTRYDNPQEKHVLLKQKSKKLSVSIDTPLCTRYIGAVVEDVKIGPSPQWMQNRLQTCGLQPINNVVDVTNYVMLETGQPLHGFDFDVLAGKEDAAKIGVRTAKKE